MGPSTQKLGTTPRQGKPAGVKSFHVNLTVLNSIPLDKGLKRYLIKWFQRMSDANGLSFAATKVKEARETMMAYIADPNRLEKLEEYEARIPIRKNGRLKQLFGYAETQPRAVLDLLKFYLGEAATQVSVEQSQDEMHELLSTIDGDRKVPQSMLTWLEYLTKSRKELYREYWNARGSQEHPYHYVCLHHSVKVWMQYWWTWYNRTIRAWARLLHDGRYDLSDVSLTVNPVPSMYADFIESKASSAGDSEQLRKDAEQFIGYFPDSNGGEEYCPVDLLDYCMSDAETGRVFNVFELDDIIDSKDIESQSVGQIHHIPKKGTIRRRAIAVPNRFLQKGMKPIQLFLYDGLRFLPRDHTFDQSKSAKYIKQRLDKHHYCCSIDLSHATDYLPYEIADVLFHHLWMAASTLVTKRWQHYSKDERVSVRKNVLSLVNSMSLFHWVRKQSWKNGEYLDSWKVGQPLGTYPSFGLLAWSHNLLAEALALSGGYIHSPYTVLGDDFLSFSKRMRKMYIQTMEELGVPLSLHKSYEHRLVEFAGLVLIEGQPVSYCPDPNKVQWYNLFDYSRNSGFLLSYRELPRGIQERISRKAMKVALSGKDLYRIAAECYFAEYGSPYNSYMAKTMEVLPLYFSLDDKPKLPAEAEVSSGWNLLSFNGKEKLAFTGRGLIRKPGTPDWVKEKFKPATTDAILRKAMRAIELFNQTPAPVV